MIPAIANTLLRRVAIMLTVVAIIVCIGPLALIKAAVRWVETEFNVDLQELWNEKETK